MTPTASERAERVVDHAFELVAKQTVPKPPHGDWMAFCDDVRCQLYLKVATAIREAERRTWEEAAGLVEERTANPTKRANAWSVRMYWLLAEFHRRAQEQP